VDQEKAAKPRLYDKRNEVIRIDHVDALDDHLAVAVMAFFRRLGVGHLFLERVVPTMSAGDSTLTVAIRDRPWPPWGLEARTIAALCQVYPVAANGVAISPVYAADEDATNIGVIAALYKEVLEQLARREGVEVNYIAAEGSVFADHILRGAGFKPSADLLVTDDTRYVFYRTTAAALRDQLGLSRLSTPALLAHEIDDPAMSRLSLFFAGLHLASQPGRIADRLVREVTWIDGGMFDASLPGGVPPTPPTRLDSVIDIPEGDPALRAQQAAPKRPASLSRWLTPWRNRQ
jgi:hypothetical protein